MISILAFIGGMAVGAILLYIAGVLLFIIGGDDGIRYQIKWWRESRREKKTLKKKAK